MENKTWCFELKWDFVSSCFFCLFRDAEKILREKELGCFLIRLSTKSIGYILSYKWVSVSVEVEVFGVEGHLNKEPWLSGELKQLLACCRGRDRCRHFLIHQSISGQFLVYGDTRVHDTVPELIEYYKTSPIQPFGERLTTSCFQVRRQRVLVFAQVVNWWLNWWLNWCFALAGTEWRAVWCHPGWPWRNACHCCHPLGFGATTFTATKEQPDADGGSHFNSSVFR